MSLEYEPASKPLHFFRVQGLRVQGSGCRDGAADAGRPDRRHSGGATSYPSPLKDLTIHDIQPMQGGKITVIEEGRFRARRDLLKRLQGILPGS